MNNSTFINDQWLRLQSSIHKTNQILSIWKLKEFLFQIMSTPQNVLDALNKLEPSDQGRLRLHSKLSIVVKSWATQNRCHGFYCSWLLMALCFEIFCCTCMPSICVWFLINMPSCIEERHRDSDQLSEPLTACYWMGWLQGLFSSHVAKLSSWKKWNDLVDWFQWCELLHCINT